MKTEQAWNSLYCVAAAAAAAHDVEMLDYDFCK
jgi:hypothetical protein